MVALQRVLVLEVGTERVVIPVGQLQSVLSVAEAQVERAGIDAFFVFKDEPLPLLSYGGTSMLAMFCLVALAANVRQRRFAR